jgi:hypothetical protein
MAKPNYSFEKRQREQAKKKKKEEKVREKAGRKAGDPGTDDAPMEGVDPGTPPVETQPAP